MQPNRLVSSSLVALAVFVSAGCGDDEKAPEPGSLGTECDPDGSACEDSLECTVRRGDSYRCTLPAGEQCDPDDAELDNGGCSSNAECVVPVSDMSEGEQALCLITEGGECDPDEALCTNGLVCAEMASEGHRCYAPVLIVGDVTDSADASAISGAHVIGIDDEGSAVTSVSVTDANGRYALALPVPRNDDGSPVDERFTLRGSAQDYQAFPEGVRVALPIDVGEASLEDEGWVIESALTDISLIRLPDGERYSIAGSVDALEVGGSSNVTGVLVVASGAEGSFSATTDKDGTFTIFNVPSGDYELDAYAADLQVESGNATVNDAAVVGVDLLEADRETVDVSGSVSVVNAPGGSVTSVILVVEDTFDADAARGEVPRGLRAPHTGAPDVSGAFVVMGVPDGDYVVLAAYENDGLVRDPDTNIAGTGFVRVTVDASAGSTMSLAESFKVTEALEVLGPGAERPEAVTEPPTLRWADDSSEDGYEVRVFDAFGNEVWSDLDVSSVSGAAEVSVDYGGPLDPGMYYQFRVLSWRQPGGGDAAPISATEDLRGVFFRPAE